MAQTDRPFEFFSKPANSDQRETFPIHVPDEHDPDAEPFTFYMRRMSLPERMLADDLRDEWVTTYITGNPADKIAPMPIQATQDGPMKLSVALIQVAARMYCMQDVPEGKAKCDMLQLLAMAHTHEVGFNALADQCLSIQFIGKPSIPADDPDDMTDDQLKEYATLIGVEWADDVSRETLLAAVKDAVKDDGLGEDSPPASTSN